MIKIDEYIKNYSYIVQYSSEDEAFLAKCIEMGIMAHGDTQEEAIQDMTVDSLELLFWNGKIKKLRVKEQVQGPTPNTKAKGDPRHKAMRQIKHMKSTQR